MVIELRLIDPIRAIKQERGPGEKKAKMCQQPEQWSKVSLKVECVHPMKMRNSS